MFRKIANWTFGSVFRTFGRIIAYLIFGIAISYLLSSLDFRITDLFLDKVNASGFTSKDFTWYGGGNLLPSFTGWPDGYSGYYVETDYHSGTLWFSATSNGGYVSIPDGSKTVTLNAILDVPISQQYGNGIIEAVTSNLIEIQLVTNGLWSTCSINTALQNGNTNNIYNVVCPIQNGVTSIHSVIIYYNFENISTYRAYIGLGRRLTFELSETQSIIDNQNQNTQSIINQQQNSTQQILDSNTTEADNTGKDFINNFSNNTHGLTGIITAPLTAIQSMASATCSPLVLPLPFTNNKTLTLPCMNQIYSQYFGAFYTMYQGIVLGLISYWVCVRIFGLAKGFKDPEDDKIEVVDL